jgi:hypothetical protein
LGLNNAFNYLSYIATNNRNISEQSNDKDVEASSQGIMEGTILAFT